MKRNHMLVNQNVRYAITEWDGTVAFVRVRTVGGRVVRRCVDGSPFLCSGGDVLMKYQDGETHRVSSKYFEGLNPRTVLELN